MKSLYFVKKYLNLKEMYKYKYQNDIYIVKYVII